MTVQKKIKSKKLDKKNTQKKAEFMGQNESKKGTTSEADENPEQVYKKKNREPSAENKKRKRKSAVRDGKEPAEKRQKKIKDTHPPCQNKIAHQDGAPDWRQIRNDAAQVREMRRSHHKMFEVGKHMKKLWEELRVEKCPVDRRNQLIKQLTAMVAGRVPQLVRAHDRARVCETLFQLGGADTRRALFDETRQQLAELSRDKYARHFVLKLLAYGSEEQKAAVGEAFRGRVPALMGHKFASEVGETYFRDCAAAEAQQRMLMEFYSADFFLTTDKPRDLAQLIEEQPEKRAIFLTNIRSQLQCLLDKQLLAASLTHRLLREYLTHCAPADRRDVIEALRDAVVQMLHTRDGARVGLLCVWWGTTKDRKAIVKSLKTYVQKVCTDEHGFLVMIALLDVVDDTRLVKKALLEELMSGVAEIVTSEHGRKVVHYLLSARDTTYFHPALLATLAEGDDNTTSKKEPAVRRRELLEAVGDALLRTASIHCLEWIQDSSMCILLTHILTKCSGESLRLSLAQLARRCAAAVTSAADSHLVNNSAAYMQLKRLVQADRQRAADQHCAVLFSTLLLEELSEEVLLTWLASNRTAFLLVIMLETEVPVVVEHLVRLLRPHTKKLKLACKGAEILKKKLSAAAKQLSTADSAD